MVNESVCRVVGGRDRALLVGSLRSLWIARRNLMRIAGRILVVYKISLGSIASAVLLLLSRLRVSWGRALALRLEDRIREGGGGRRVGAGVRNELLVTVPKIQVETVGIVVIHDGRLCRCDWQSVGVGLEGAMW